MIEAAFRFEKKRMRERWGKRGGKGRMQIANRQRNTRLERLKTENKTSAKAGQGDVSGGARIFGVSDSVVDEERRKASRSDGGPFRKFPGKLRLPARS